MIGRGNEITITIDPAREEAKSREEEVRTAAKNDGASLRGWFVEEAAWLTAQFVKIATSVAVVRWVHQLFSIGYASESAYQRAPDLWSHGHRQHDRGSFSSTYTRPSSTAWRPGGSGPESPSRGSTTFEQHNDDAAADAPRYVSTTEGGHHLYYHRKILRPGSQFWPCPLLYVTACESCSFLEYDRGGRPQCVALWKLRTVLDGTNAGEDLAEIRQWIRSS
jgi:hypothetical protein